MRNVDGTEDFGPWLARQLRMLDLKQADLAQRVGVTRAAVSAWITGRATPREETMRAIAEAIGADIAVMHSRTTDAVSGGPVRWYHRPAYQDGGRDFGNAAAFAFEADVKVLAREATQNSLDEQLDRTRPVRVRYTLHELTGEMLAEFLAAVRWGELLPHYEAAAAQDQKVGRVVAEGLNELARRDRLLLLRVDDYNTTGLTGDDYDDGRFAAVVRRQLESRKSEDPGRAAGGSYGLGKATLWATSRLGMVLVNSTLSEAHEGRTRQRVVGRLDLPWRKAEGKPWAGPAWFGQADTAPGNEGVARSWWADDETVTRLHLTRENSEPGTSFLVVGAHDVAGTVDEQEDGEDNGGDEQAVTAIHKRLVDGLAENFWAAMTAGRDRAPLLEASVRTLRNGKVLVEEQRVDPEEKQPARTRALRAFFDGETVERITEVGQVALARVPLKVPVPGGGRETVEHRAALLVTAAEDGHEPPNRLVTMRGGLMVVRAARVPELGLGADAFQAVLLAGHAAGTDAGAAEEAEAFLRASEPPEHNKWGRTEELLSVYSRTAHRRISTFTTAAYAAVRDLTGRRPDRTAAGPGRLRDLLVLDDPGPRPARAGGFPAIRDLDAEIDASGAWRIRAEVKLPRRRDPWVMGLVAKFDVRSGPRPTVGWSEIVAVENCRFVDGALHFDAGATAAVFTGITDTSTHPVRADLAGLIVELQKGKGTAE
ncbi:helix-turn-helix transcriptional regulator [Streptomyces sp. NPDC020875]|uniref:helix-turn-helix transcriptional regulator n=1 Tax=Streptomyces sp. NPDC020875 TaxID=3154898 RepID=UPI0033FA6D34